MSNFETSAALRNEPPTAVESPRPSRPENARAFLTQLVACELRLAGRIAEQLRAAGSRGHERGLAPGLSEDCIRLATQTWELREQLIELDRKLGHTNQLEQPLSEAAQAFLAHNEELLAGPTPWAVLSALSSIELLLCEAVPFAIDIACGTQLEDEADLVAASELYETRYERATSLRNALANAGIDEATHRSILRPISDRAIEIFTQIMCESAASSHRLDG